MNAAKRFQPVHIIAAGIIWHNDIALMAEQPISDRLSKCHHWLHRNRFDFSGDNLWFELEDILCAGLQNPDDVRRFPFPAKAAAAKCSGNCGLIDFFKPSCKGAIEILFCDRLRAIQLNRKRRCRCILRLRSAGIGGYVFLKLIGAPSYLDNPVIRLEENLKCPMDAVRRRLRRSVVNALE